LIDYRKSAIDVDYPSYQHWLSSDLLVIEEDPHFSSANSIRPQIYINQQLHDPPRQDYCVLGVVLHRIFRLLVPLPLRIQLAHVPASPLSHNPVLFIAVIPVWLVIVAVLCVCYFKSTFEEPGTPSYLTVL
jgi:hypothetical protein